MAVIAVLVAVAIPTFGSQLEKSRQAVDLSNLRGAYAAAKMEILNQDDIDSILNEKKADVYTFYNPDTGAWASDSSGSGMAGKATTGSVIISTEGLPEVIFYSDGTLSTTTKAVMVKFSYDNDSDTFSLSSNGGIGAVKFAGTASSGWPD